MGLGISEFLTIALRHFARQRLYTLANLNETAVKKLSLEDPVGRTLKLQNNEGWIIGVVKDFHMRRLTEKLHPNIFVFKPQQFRVVNLRLGSGDMSDTMKFLEDTWKTYIPVRPFRYIFLDERLEINILL